MNLEPRPIPTGRAPNGGDEGSGSRAAPSRNANTEGIWVPFFWAAVGLALVVGFGLGGALFALPVVGATVGGWWVAAARVHGHVQLIGWAGLMVLGVGLHFLPRLRGRALARSEHARSILDLLVAALVLRALTEPVLAASASGTAAPVLQIGLVLSGVLELVGISLAIVLLALTVRGDPPAQSRSGLLQVLPILGIAFGGFWLSGVANLLSVWSLAEGNGAAGTTLDRVAVLLAMYVFLVPISVGMGIRVFPLHFAAQQPDLRIIRAGVVFLLVGLLLRIGGDAAGFQGLVATGLLLVAVALVLFLVGLRVFAARRRVPGARKAWYADAAQWCGLTACGWLALDALLLAFTAVATLTGAAAGAWMDAERHLFGAGFVTLLIFGEGANLLPGFARRPLRHEGFVWATLGLGNCAVLLRVAPLITPAVFQGAAAGLALAAAGVVDLLAVCAFAVNIGLPGLQATGIQPSARGEVLRS
jgi:uncharacterized protein involved in response to NO